MMVIPSVGERSKHFPTQLNKDSAEVKRLQELNARQFFRHDLSVDENKERVRLYHKFKRQQADIVKRLI